MTAIPDPLMNNGCFIKGFVDFANSGGGVHAMHAQEGAFDVYFVIGM